MMCDEPTMMEGDNHVYPTQPSGVNPWHVAERPNRTG
jgi:hypothetical protein